MCPIDLPLKYHGGIMGRRMRRQGPGRPAGPPGKVRKNRISVFVTDAEMEKLEKLAEDAEEPLGTFAYQIISAFLKRRA